MINDYNNNHDNNINTGQSESQTFKHWLQLD